ncbi:MAG TPA: hypothetical protein PKW79_02845 [Rhabdochlamydiaceae bacterium]|nr:hypothetical protein [Rhabdochlamydiaceae bacterium]
MSQVMLEAILDKITSLKDGSFKILFESQELSAEKGAILFSMRNSFGWLAFAPQQAELKIPDEPAFNSRIEKSRSQRLRNSLFVWWKQLGSQGDFEDFYNKQMERFISMVKEKLDPEV